MPDCNFVLVGPEDEAFKESDLHHIKNIHFLGPKPMDEVRPILSLWMFV